MNLPPGWYEEPPDSGAAYQVHKTSDVDVIVTIVAHGVDRYEVPTSAESRTSGPNDTSIGFVATFDAAKPLLEACVTEWEQDLA